MHKLIRIATLLFVAVLVLSLTASVVFTQEPPGKDKIDLDLDLDPNTLIGEAVPFSSLQSIDAFWTADKLEAAQPLPLPIVSDVSLSRFEETDAGPVGPGGAASSAFPDADVSAAALAAFDPATLAAEYPSLEATDYADFNASAPLAVDYSYPPPFTRYPVNANWQQHRYFPFTTIGKFFFTIPNTPNTWSCSGSVGYRRVVWTAGHCVYTKGKGWHQNMIFIPAYKNWGSIREPYGRFTVTSTQTLVGWTSDENYAYDIAMVRVADKSGKYISQYTGYLGFLYNQSAVQHWHAFGYPSNINDGRFTYACVASLSSVDPRPGPDTMGMGCDMTHGSSGGPWIVKYRPYAAGANNYVNGNVSYGKTGKTLEFFSPYYTSGALNLYNWGKAQ